MLLLAFKNLTLSLLISYSSVNSNIPIENSIIENFRFDCAVGRITLTINGNCVGSIRCDGESYHIPCCSDFGIDVGWCRTPQQD